MTRWDLVSQALRLDAVRQSQLVAQASTLSRRRDRRTHRLVEVDQGEARCPRSAGPGRVSIPGTEWQRGVLSLGAAWLSAERVRVAA